MNKLKELLLNNKWLLIITLLFIVVLSNVAIWNYFEKEKLKAKVLEKSDEEVLITEIKVSKESIKELEILLKNTELNIKTETNKQSCLKEQLNRLVEWLSYNLNYCDNKDNLSKFEVGE